MSGWRISGATDDRRETQFMEQENKRKSKQHPYALGNGKPGRTLEAPGNAGVAVQPRAHAVAWAKCLDPARCAEITPADASGALPSSALSPSAKRRRPSTSFRISWFALGTTMSPICLSSL